MPTASFRSSISGINAARNHRRGLLLLVALAWSNAFIDFTRSKAELERETPAHDKDLRPEREDRAFADKHHSRDFNVQLQGVGSAGAPATLGLLAVLLGLVAWFGGKAMSAAVLAVLSAVLGALSLYSLTKPEPADAPRDRVDLEEKDWSDIGIDELKEAGEETRRRKRDVVKSWLKWAVYGSEPSISNADHATHDMEARTEVQSAIETSSETSDTSSPLSASDANLTLKVSSETKKAEPKSKQAGAEALMAQPLGDVLAAMGQDGWEVRPRDPARGLYELFLPAVEYDLGMGSVSIPSPHFLATLQESSGSRSAASGEKERCTAKLALQNGNGILTVKLGFPFSTTLSLSAAGEVQARLGVCDHAVYLQGDVDLGLWLPNVPGLSKIMRTFVKTYANQSIKECTTALANRADEVFKTQDVNQKSAVAVAVATAAVAASEIDAGLLAGQIISEVEPLLLGS